MADTYTKNTVQGVQQQRQHVASRTVQKPDLPTDYNCPATGCLGPSVPSLPPGSEGFSTIEYTVTAWHAVLIFSVGTFLFLTASRCK
jgi:hypothetical protein